MTKEGRRFTGSTTVNAALDAARSGIHQGIRGVPHARLPARAHVGKSRFRNLHIVKRNDPERPLRGTTNIESSGYRYPSRQEPTALRCGNRSARRYPKVRRGYRRHKRFPLTILHKCWEVGLGWPRDQWVDREHGAHRKHGARDAGLCPSVGNLQVHRLLHLPERPAPRPPPARTRPPRLPNPWHQATTLGNTMPPVRTGAHPRYRALPESPGATLGLKGKCRRGSPPTCGWWAHCNLPALRRWAPAGSSMARSPLDRDRDRGGRGQHLVPETALSPHPGGTHHGPARIASPGRGRVGSGGRAARSLPWAGDGGAPSPYPMTQRWRPAGIRWRRSGPTIPGPIPRSGTSPRRRSALCGARSAGSGCWTPGVVAGGSLGPRRRTVRAYPRWTSPPN